MALGPNEREAGDRRIEELRAQLLALVDQPLERHAHAEQWRKLLDELSELRGKLDGGASPS
jgi:hypothetical protein